MTATQITAGSPLLWTLAHITEHDEAGRHFTEIYPADVLATLEELGHIEIDRPVHQPTGIPYSQKYHHLTVTPKGMDTVAAGSVAGVAASGWAVGRTAL